MSDTFYTSVKRVIKRNKDLSFIVILFLGFGTIFLSTFEWYATWDEPDWQTAYQNVMYNMSAGFFIASITYFLLRIFVFDEGELIDLKGYKKPKTTDILSIQESVKIIKSSIQRLEISTDGSQTFFNKEELFQQICSIIKGASDKVYSVGYGFNYDTHEESNMAEIFISSIRRFLKENSRAEFRHYQYNRSLNTSWLIEMKMLKKEFETSFNFYYGNMGNPTNPIWIITVDPESENTYTVVIITKEMGGDYDRSFDFVMGFIFNEENISKKKQEFFNPHFKTESKSYSEISGIINEFEIESRESLDDYMESNPDKQNIEKENLRKIGRFLNIYDFRFIRKFMLERIMENRYYYFAYGLDMNPGHFENRCPETIKIGIAHIKSHNINASAIGFEGKERESRILNIVPLKNQPENFVYGVLYGVKKETFEIFEERRRNNGFVIKEVKAKMDGKEMPSKVIFHPKAKQLNHQKISDEYRGELEALLGRVNLHEKYKNDIKNLLS